MSITRTLAFLALAAAASSACDRLKPPEPTAKNDMAGKIVFSQGSFDDAKKYKTFDEFKAANKVIDEFVVTAPESSLKYYAVFQEPLNAEEYVVQVFDRTEGISVRSERRDGTPTTGQTTAGWTFAIPEWPLPEIANPDEVVVNEIWIKPGHSYEVVILKPLAKGSFRIADAPRAEKPDAAKPKPKSKKGG
jgi:hypothetical protein